MSFFYNFANRFLRKFEEISTLQIMKLTLLIATCVFTLFNCWITDNGKIEKAAWLIGTWEQKTDKGPVYESWQRISNVELSGKSFMTKDKDTIILETIRLTQEQNGLYYIPTVKNQNTGLPVRFVLKSLSDKQMVFENPRHDFPQIISYSRIGTDSLIAEISGAVNGQLRQRYFPMRKVNVSEMR